MEKREILERSRKENTNGDEREQKALADSNKLTIIIAFLFTIIFTILDMILQKGLMLSGVAMIIASAEMLASSIYCYCHTKKKYYLFTSILWSVALVARSVGVIIEYVSLFSEII